MNRMTKIENKLFENKNAQLLYKDISILIERCRIRIALAVNQEITMLYWQIGKAINTSVLKNNAPVMAKQLLRHCRNNYAFLR